jgi:uncharacterized lipoprotein YehR (DUF1307 family)
MKKLFFILFFILLIPLVSINSQEQLVHKEKIHITESGRLYVNKAKPLYLWMSHSPDENAEKVRLKSESSPQYSNPFYLDQDGYNTIRTPSQVDTITKKVVIPKRDIIFEIYADSKSPITKINYGTSNIYKNYLGKDFKISFKSKDFISGVDTIYTSLNFNKFKTLNEDSLNNTIKEGLSIIKYYAVDNVGNVENIKKDSLIFDFNSPKTSLKISGDYIRNILAPNCKINLTALDSLSGVKQIFYSIDSSKYKPYLNEISIRNLPEGDHTISYYSVDRVNNKEEVKSLEFFLDKSAPMVVSEIIGSKFNQNGKYYSSGFNKVKITAFDNKAGVKEVLYSTNGKDYVKYDVPFSINNFKGDLQIRYIAIDSIGNSTNSLKTQNQNFRRTYVDLTGPNLNYKFLTPVYKIRDTIFINSNSKISLAAKDTESGVKKIEYTLNKDSIKLYKEPFAVDSSGLNKLKVTITDNVDNTTTNDISFIVDNEAPIIGYQFSSPSINGKYPANTSLFIEAFDQIVGFKYLEYSLNGGAYILYKSYINRFMKGEHIIKVRAYDDLNNVSELEIKFEIF